jgi:hypothetical protein
MPKKIELTIHEQIVVEMALMMRANECRKHIKSELVGSHFRTRLQDCKSVYQKVSGNPMPDPE